MPIVDVDSHVYEPSSIWEHYISAGERLVAKEAFWFDTGEDGNRLTVLNGFPAPELNRSRLVRQAVWRPGMTPSDVAALNPDSPPSLNEGGWDAGARLADMDQMGVDHAIVYPTLFAEYLPSVANPVAAGILARAYNDWVWDFTDAGRGRLHPVAVLPLQSILLARRELQRVAERGFRAVLMRPMFYRTPSVSEHGKEATISRIARGISAGAPTSSFDSGARGAGLFIEDRPFRPIWQLLEDLDLVACVHPSLGITNSEMTSHGGFIERVSDRLQIGHSVAEAVAYQQDGELFLVAALFHGLLEDFPRLRIALAHTGASWVPLILEKAETFLWVSLSSVYQPVSLEPQEVWDEHPIVVGFDSWERSLAQMPDLFSTKAAWGSRYPQHDASGPAEAKAMLQGYGVTAPTIERLLGGNAAALFQLAAVVDAA